MKCHVSLVLTAFIFFSRNVLEDVSAIAQLIVIDVLCRDMKNYTDTGNSELFFIKKKRAVVYGLMYF